MTTATFTLPALSLTQRELVRFFRQPGRVIGALATPILLWLFLGSGLRTSFVVPDAQSQAGYLNFAYAGMLALVVLFTSIFSSISVIQDRDQGFLQSVLVSPATRSSIAIGKTLGSTLLACIQGIVLLALAPLVGIDLTFVTIGLTVVLLFIMAVGLSALGFAMAWRSESVQGFHSVMNLLLFPMWLLSGALFPMSGASGWLQKIMMLNPLTYGVTGVRLSLNGEIGRPLVIPVLVTTGFAAVLTGVAVWTVRRTNA